VRTLFHAPILAHSFGHSPSFTVKRTISDRFTQIQALQIQNFPIDFGGLF
jgi:hypothetical protein